MGVTKRCQIGWNSTKAVQITYAEQALIILLYNIWKKLRKYDREE
jgi:hypothetical protein